MGIARSRRGLPTRCAQAIRERSLGPNRSPFGLFAVPGEGSNLSRAKPPDIRYAPCLRPQSALSGRMDRILRGFVPGAKRRLASGAPQPLKHRIAWKCRPTPALAHNSALLGRSAVGLADLAYFACGYDGDLHACGRPGRIDSQIAPHLRDAPWGSRTLIDSRGRSFLQIRPREPSGHRSSPVFRARR